MSNTVLMKNKLIVCFILLYAFAFTAQAQDSIALSKQKNIFELIAMADIPEEFRQEFFLELHKAALSPAGVNSSTVLQLFQNTVQGFEILFYPKEAAIKNEVDSFQLATGYDLQVRTTMQNPAHMNNIFVRLENIASPVNATDVSASYYIDVTSTPNVITANTIIPQNILTASGLSQSTAQTIVQNAVNNSKATTNLGKVEDGNRALATYFGVKGGQGTTNTTGQILSFSDCNDFCTLNNAGRLAYLFQKELLTFDENATSTKQADGSYFVFAKMPADATDDEDGYYPVYYKFAPYTTQDQLQVYLDFLSNWKVDLIYTSIVEADYPTQSPIMAFITLGGNNCAGLCKSYSMKVPPKSVQFIADVITAPYTAPGKILYGTNFIFQDQDVTTTDQVLALLDVPGLGYVSKAIAIKMGIGAVIKAGITIVFTSGDALTKAIKNSGVAQLIIDAATTALQKATGRQKDYVLKALTDGTITVNEVPTFITAVNNAGSRTWDDAVSAWNKANITIQLIVSKPIEFGGDVIKREGIDLYILGRVSQKDVTTATTTLFAFKKGVNVLTTPIGNMSVDVYWTTVNKPFIDKAIQSGADMRFIHNPTDALHSDTWLKKEYDYLISLGYELQNNGMMILK